MTVIERLKKESETRTAAMIVEKAVDKAIEDKAFGRTSARAWEIAYKENHAR